MKDLEKILKLFNINKNEKVFRKCINKVPLNDNLYSYIQIQNVKTQLAIVIPNNFILIDIDTNKESDILNQLLKEQNINAIIIKTRQGRHFYFETNEILPQVVASKSTIGLTIDTRISKKGNGVLPMNTKDRHFEIIPDKIDNLPCWLRPDSQTYKKLNVEFPIIKGKRNNELFRILNALRDFTDLSSAEILTTIRLINLYMTEEPISMNELEIMTKNISLEREKKGQIQLKFDL